MLSLWLTWASWGQGSKLVGSVVVPCVHMAREQLLCAVCPTADEGAPPNGARPMAAMLWHDVALQLKGATDKTGIPCWLPCKCEFAVKGGTLRGSLLGLLQIVAALHNE